MKLIYSVALVLCWLTVVFTVPFIFVGGAAGWVAQKMMRLGDKCATKTTTILLLALLLGGCEIKSLHERVWDSEKNLIKKIDVTVASCLMSTKARNIIAVTSDKLLFVGDFSQVPDPASVKAVFSAVAEAWWPWWKGMKL